MSKKKSTFMSDFKKFITRGNVVDMAVGVAVAGAFTAIVTAFTNGFIAPLLALLSHDASLADFKWVLRPEVVEELNEAGEVITKGTPEVAILWGAFLQAIIDFLLIAFVMFCVLRIFMKTSNKLAEMRQEMEEKAHAAELEAKAEEEAKAAEAAAAAAAEAEAAAAAEAAAKEKQIADDRAEVYKQTELLEKIAAALEKK